CNAGKTTNIAESAHADANREGIKMNLLLAIRKFESASSTKKVSLNSNATAIGNEELNDLDLEIAKYEKLRKLELIEYEFQHKKEMLDIDKQTKLASLYAQELANIKKEKELGINK
ncbi:7435_t:CDS:2, partial [Scutellospora calospora]